MSDSWTLRCDGGARGNPGPAGAGFVLEDAAGQVVRAGGRFLGVATNNVAEYEALIAGLAAARDAGARRLKVRADSELVVKQVNGAYKVRQPHLVPLHRRVRELIAGFDHVHVGHVRREENCAADALANEAMDLRADVGDVVPPSGQGALFDG